MALAVNQKRGAMPPLPRHSRAREGPWRIILTAFRLAIPIGIEFRERLLKGLPQVIRENRIGLLWIRHHLQHRVGSELYGKILIQAVRHGKQVDRLDSAGARCPGHRDHR